MGLNGKTAVFDISSIFSLKLYLRFLEIHIVIDDNDVFEKISKRISDAVHFFELQPQIRHFLAKIGLFVKSFCIIFDVAHTKYN